MRVRALRKAQTKLKNDLENFIVNREEHERKLQEKKRKMHPQYRRMQLTGAARPAKSLELSDHGCGLRVFECEERCVRDEDLPKTRNLFKELSAGGNFWSHPLGKKYCTTSSNLARAARASGKTKLAIIILRDLLVKDKEDHCHSRRQLILALLETGDAAHARQELEIAGKDKVKGDPFMAWSACLIEFISYFLLHEEGTTEASAEAALQIALAANKHVGIFLSHIEEFQHSVDSDAIVDLLDSDSADKIFKDQGSIETALLYCVDQLLCWADSEECVEGSR